MLTALIVFGCLVAAVLFGRILRRLLPEEHLSSDSRDTVKLAMGLIATMSALVLGLLVSSAKGSYDAERNEVIQMAAKIAFLNRVLAAYGPEAAPARAQVSQVVEQAVEHVWRAEVRPAGQLAPSPLAGDLAYVAIQQLSPGNDMQRSLKAQALSQLTDLGQLRALLVAQSIASISQVMLIILISWLVIIFLGFSVVAPPNVTTVLALVVSAFAVSGAIFLILELDQPFGGVIHISSEPMLNALHQLAH
jgi:hypothetical protein